MIAIMYDASPQMGLNTAPLGQLFLPSSSNAVSYDFNRQ